MDCLNIVNSLVRPELKDQLTSWFWNHFFYSRAANIVNAKPDSELQSKLLQAYDLIGPLADEIRRAKVVKEDLKLETNVKVIDLIKNNRHIVDKEILEMMP